MKSQSVEPQNLSQKHALLASRDQNTAFAAQGRREWFRENRVGIVAVCFMLAAMAFGLAYMTLSSARRAALLKTPAKQGQAYVLRKRYYDTGGKTPFRHYEIDFRLNGREITALPYYYEKWLQTPTETTVSVTYHVGENGEVLISDWQAPAK